MKRWMRYIACFVGAVLALGACHKDRGPYTREGGPEPVDGPGGGGSSQPSATLVLREQTDWKLQYLGRGVYTEDGSGDCVELFECRYTGDQRFILRCITPANLEEVYEGDAAAFFTDEVTLLVNNGTLDQEAFDASLKGNIALNMLLHGQWLTYLIEVGANNAPTGSYALCRHLVEEETPTAAYASWLGTWHVQDDAVGFDITLSQAEANWLYYVDGWETGKTVLEQMNLDGDWFFARFRGGTVYFYGQYIASYQDESLGTDPATGETVWVDQMFVGTYLTASSDAIGEVDGLGADLEDNIAHVERSGEALRVVPETISFDNGYTFTYHTMRYSRYCYDQENWAHYNQVGVPELPFSFIPAGSRAAAERTRTGYARIQAGSEGRTHALAGRASLRRVQPGRHQIRRSRKG